MTRPILHRQVSWTDAKAYRPDLFRELALANAVPAPRLAVLRDRYVSAYRRCRGAIAFAIDALMWAVFAGCFLLLASGAL